MRGRPSPIVLTVTLGLACIRPNPLFGDESTTGATTETTDPTTDVPTTGLSSGTGTPTTGEPATSTGAIEGSSTGLESTSNGATTGTTEVAGTTGDDGPPATCAETRDRGGTASGVYTLLVPGQAGATIDVWCEQQVAEGGWLLVARSAPTDMPPAFGWGSASGDILDDAAPYSLNLLAHKYPAAELLIANYSAGKQPGSHVYKLAAPAGFPFAFGISTGMTSAAQTVFGDCVPGGGPSMLRWVGYTMLADRFRLRDKPDNDASDIYGLFADGFVLGGDNCSNAGKLDNSQGMIFVR